MHMELWEDGILNVILVSGANLVVLMNADELFKYL